MSDSPESEHLFKKLPGGTGWPESQEGGGHECKGYYGRSLWCHKCSVSWVWLHEATWLGKCMERTHMHTHARWMDCIIVNILVVTLNSAFANVTTREKVNKMETGSLCTISHNCR